MIGLAGGLLGGFLGRYWLGFDIFSHFRLHFLGGFLVCALAYILPRSIRVAFLVLGGFAVPVVIGLQAVLLERTSGLPAPAVQSSGSKSVSIVSFNTWLKNKDWRTIANYLRRMDADFVVMVEFGASKKPLFSHLKALYPYQRHCSGQRACQVAILSKHKWIKTGLKSASYQSPPQVWAKFGADLGGLTLVGTHLIRPPRMNTQLNQLKALAQIRQKHSGPLIIAGDFNATPWSVMFQEFSRLSGLTSVISTIPTWPVNLVELPQIPIDHIFISPDIKQQTANAGPSLGSDHLPVYARVTIPR